MDHDDTRTAWTSEIPSTHSMDHDDSSDDNHVISIATIGKQLSRRRNSTADAENYFPTTGAMSGSVSLPVASRQSKPKQRPSVIASEEYFPSDLEHIQQGQPMQQPRGALLNPNLPQEKPYSVAFAPEFSPMVGPTPTPSNQQTDAPKLTFAMSADRAQVTTIGNFVTGGDSFKMPGKMDDTAEDTDRQVGDSQEKAPSVSPWTVFANNSQQVMQKAGSGIAARAEVSFQTGTCEHRVRDPQENESFLLQVLGAAQCFNCCQGKRSIEATALDKLLKEEAEQKTTRVADPASSS